MTNKYVHLVLILLTIVAIVCSIVESKKINIIQKNPSGEIAITTKNIIKHRNFSSTHFYQIYEKTIAVAKKSKTTLWQDVFAIGSKGQLLPKHSIISSILAIPFYILFDDYGFLVFNSLMFIILILSTYYILTSLCINNILIPFLFICLITTETILHIPTLSYDLHATTIILLGLAILKKHSLYGAFILTLSIFVRPSHILIVLPLAFAYYKSKDFNIKDIIIGLGFGGILIGLINYLFWGNPFLTAYHRLVNITPEGLEWAKHSYGFDISYFISNWWEKLFGENSIVKNNPITLLLPFIPFYIYKHKKRFFLTITLFSALLYTFYMFSYPFYPNGGATSRTLLPSVYLYLLSVMVCIDILISKLKLPFLRRP